MTMTGFDYLATMSEAQFQQQVVRLAEQFKWNWYHTHDSRRSPSGFPDLVLTRSGLLIFAELKAQNGRLSRAQDEWVAEIGKAEFFAPNVIMRVWRPSDLPGIQKLLQSGWKIKINE